MILASLDVNLMCLDEYVINTQEEPSFHPKDHKDIVTAILILINDPDSAMRFLVFEP